MTPEKQEELLINVDKNVNLLLERHTVRDRLCEARLIMINDLTNRVDVVEDFIDKEKNYRKLVVSLLIGLGALITWGMNLFPKLTDLLGKGA
ncbi:MAG TPA: hypothetical protein DIC53_03060 [Synergistaceae bacterium]|jgi:hypothetical protein|nr:hypothetical protein [Synergistaceae bacterium]